MAFKDINHFQSIMIARRKSFENYDYRSVISKSLNSSRLEDHQALKMAIQYKNAEVSRLLASISSSRAANDQKSLNTDIIGKCDTLREVADRFRPEDSQTKSQEFTDDDRKTLEASETLIRDLKLEHMKILKYRADQLQMLFNQLANISTHLVERREGDQILPVTELEKSKKLNAKLECIWRNCDNEQQNRALEAYNYIIQKSSEKAYHPDAVKLLKDRGLGWSQEECELRVKESLSNYGRDHLLQEKDQLIVSLNQSYESFVKSLGGASDRFSYELLEQKENLFSTFNDFFHKFGQYTLSCKKLLASVLTMTAYDKSLINLDVENSREQIDIAREVLLKKEVLKLLHRESSTELPLDGSSFWSPNDDQKTIACVNIAMKGIIEKLDPKYQMGTSDQSTSEDEMSGIEFSSEKSHGDQAKADERKKPLTALLNEAYKDFIKSFEDEKNFRPFSISLQEKVENLFFTFNDFSDKFGKYELACQKVLKMLPAAIAADSLVSIFNEQDSLKNIKRAWNYLHQKDVLLKEEVSKLLRGEELVKLPLNGADFWSPNDEEKTISCINMVFDEIKETVKKILNFPNQMDISDELESDDEMLDTEIFSKSNYQLALSKATLLHHREHLGSSMDENEQTLFKRIDEVLSDLASLAKKSEKGKGSDPKTVLESCNCFIRDLKLNHINNIGPNEDDLEEFADSFYQACTINSASEDFSSEDEDEDEGVNELSAKYKLLSDYYKDKTRVSDDLAIKSYDWFTDQYFNNRVTTLTEIGKSKNFAPSEDMYHVRLVFDCMRHRFPKREKDLKGQVDQAWETFRAAFNKKSQSSLEQLKERARTLSDRFETFYNTFTDYSENCKETIEEIERSIGSIVGIKGIEKAQQHFDEKKLFIDSLTEKLLDPEAKIDQSSREILEQSSFWNENDEKQINFVSVDIAEATMKWHNKQNK